MHREMKRRDLILGLGALGLAAGASEAAAQTGKVKVLVVYFTRTGNTQAMAEYVAEGARSAGAEVEVKRVDYATIYDLVQADAAAFGTPSYWGTMAGMLKSFFESLYTSARKEVEGKPAAVFVSGSVIENIGELMGARQVCQDVERRIEYFKMKKIQDGVVCVMHPDDKAGDACRELGKALAIAAKARK